MNAPSEKPFSCAFLSASHASDTTFSSSITRRHGSGGDHFETGAVALGAIARVAHFGAIAFRDVERRQAHARFLAEFHQRQAEVDIHRQIGVGHVVEHAARVVTVGRFAELPREFLVALGISDRPRQRDPAASGDLKHDESVALRVKQKTFVAEHRDVGDGARRRRRRCP